MQHRALARALALAMLLQTPAFGATSALRPPTSGAIPIAIVTTEGVNVIDFAGPWEEFQDTARPGTEEPAFHLFTVSESRRPLRLTGGLVVVPDFAFEDAPTPCVVVVGAQGRSDALLRWPRGIAGAAQTAVLMSVCTGAFKLADAGLLEGKHATTHRDFFDDFTRRYHGITLERGPRFVQSGPHLFTAGGLTSGIDLACISSRCTTAMEPLVTVRDM